MNKHNEKPKSPKIGDLCVWHNPQVGAVSSFYYPVTGLTHARQTIDLLAYYDLWQFENNVKGDYASASGLMVYEELDDDEGVWIEWSSEDGYSIDEVMRDEVETEVEESEVTDHAVLAKKTAADTVATLRSLASVAHSRSASHWTTVVESSQDKQPSKFGHGRVPTYLLADVDKNKVVNHRNQTLSKVIAEGSLQWREVVTALSPSRGLGGSEAGYSYHAFITFLRKMNSHDLDMYRGYFLLYASDVESKHVSSAIEHYAIACAENNVPTTRLAALRLSMNWINSMEVQDAKFVTKTHNLISASCVTNYYCMLNAIKVEL